MLLFLLLDDLEAQTREHANFTSSEGSGPRVDSAAGIHENVDTKAATKSKEKVFLLCFSLKCNYELKQKSNYSSYYCFFEYS